MVYILRNTPLLDLIGEHKKYWESVLDPNELKREVLTGQIQEQKVPDLEVYIANLWPTIVDRKNDILYLLSGRWQRYYGNFKI
jgi:hypothetical protein